VSHLSLTDRAVLPGGKGGGCVCLGQSRQVAFGGRAAQIFLASGKVIEELPFAGAGQIHHPVEIDVISADQKVGRGIEDAGFGRLTLSCRHGKILAVWT